MALVESSPSQVLLLLEVSASCRSLRNLKSRSLIEKLGSAKATWAFSKMAQLCSVSLLRFSVGGGHRKLLLPGLPAGLFLLERVQKGADFNLAVFRSFCYGSHL